jgi:DNA-binding beta-propeller fold protein YncE
MRRFCIQLFAAVVIATTLSLPVSAVSLFPTFTDGPGGRDMQTLDAYSALESIPLDASGPEDLHVDVSGEIFIADTGNGRLLVISDNGISSVIGEGILSAPSGVFADEERIYAADPVLCQVVVFNRQGDLLFRIARPESPAYGTGTGYVPRKVAADKRGNIYVVSDNSPNGVLQFNNMGVFNGFTGANTARLGWVTTLQRLLYTEGQKSQLLDVRPPSPTNLTIDLDGLLYTATLGLDDKGIKKFSTAGKALLSPDLPYSTLVDVAVDGAGNIYACENTGYIHVANARGDRLFSFGTRAQYYEVAGVTRNPAALDISPQGVIYVLDKEQAAVVRYVPTIFGRKVLAAVSYYVQGLYVDGEQLWLEIWKDNSSYLLAHSALAYASFKQGRYDEALESFRLGEDKRGYSEAFWYIRNEWLQKNLTTILLFLLAAVLVYYALKAAFKKTARGRSFTGLVWRVGEQPFIRQLHFSFYYIRHPVDGVYEIKYNNSAGIGAATFVFGLYLAVQLFAYQVTGYLYRGSVEEVGLFSLILISLLPFALGITASYLVSEINDGQAKLREVYIIVAYSLVPYILIAPCVAIISNALTFNENFLYDLSLLTATGWSAFLIVSGLKEAYDYPMGGIVKNLLQTAFTVACMIVVTAVAGMLVTQEWTFIQIIFREVAMRVG